MELSQSFAAPSIAQYDIIYNIGLSKVIVLLQMCSPKRVTKLIGGAQNCVESMGDTFKSMWTNL